jgi:L-aspartate oxidase
MENLIQAVSEHPNIELRCDTMAVDLLISTRSAEAEEEDDEHSLIKYCTGAMLLSQGVVQSVTADNVIMATGGCGDLFANTSNPSNARGDGIAIALRAGASVVSSPIFFLQYYIQSFSFQAMFRLYY